MDVHWAVYWSLFTSGSFLFFHGPSYEVRVRHFQGPPLPGSATPRIHHFQGPPLPGSATPRVSHSQGPPLPGSATPRVRHYIRYPNISSIQLLFQQIIIILINSNFRSEEHTSEL